MENLVPGHYWVKLIGDDEWTIGKYEIELDTDGTEYSDWQIVGSDEIIETKHFSHIINQPIERVILDPPPAHSPYEPQIFHFPSDGQYYCTGGDSVL